MSKDDDDFFLLGDPEQTGKERAAALKALEADPAAAAACEALNQIRAALARESAPERSPAFVSRGMEQVRAAEPVPFFREITAALSSVRGWCAGAAAVVLLVAIALGSGAFEREGVSTEMLLLAEIQDEALFELLSSQGGDAGDDLVFLAFTGG